MQRVNLSKAKKAGRKRTRDVEASLVRLSKAVSVETGPRHRQVEEEEEEDGDECGLLPAGQGLGVPSQIL